MPSMTPDEFVEFVARARAARGAGRAGERGGEWGGTLAVPIGIRLLSDQLTPVLAYRRLVSADERTAASFLLESVEGGDRQARHSILGARPIIELTAHQNSVGVLDRRQSDTPTTREAANPVDLIRELSAGIELCVPPDHVSQGRLPSCVLGGWFGYASYDTVRHAEPSKLGFESAPPDDRELPDLSFAFYDGVVVFDNASKTVHVVQLAMVGEGDDASEVYARTVESIQARAVELETHSKPLALGRVDRAQPVEALPSNTTKGEHQEMVDRALEYIRAGDVFQVVIGQRFERESAADPFDVYRALRSVNPSPYMVYLQAPGVILVSASPEILCRVRKNKDGTSTLTNRPLAGTRKRGQTRAEDEALEKDLLADKKETSEHVMLVDLGRNDVGMVAVPGSVSLDDLMSIERYSHVMHISSTVTGTLRGGLDCWDALRATLPVGTISGAPKIRAMQIIDELEKVRRGPYGGGLGWVSLDGEMDIALALRTIVVPTEMRKTVEGKDQWMYHIQAAGGIVADSDAGAEFDETVNKAAALARAVELAERAFG
ncbi:MAG: anthranilate synthase component 1 [Phycisphaerales bacterium]|jgi:anthranilate synthase component 1